MPIYDIYSKREKRERGEVPDVYIYDQISKGLRIQIWQIIEDTLGDEQSFKKNASVKGCYKYIVQALRREYGTFSLFGDPNYTDEFDELRGFYLSATLLKHLLDVIELCFKGIDSSTRYHNYLYRSNYNVLADNAINELNYRFREWGVGYQFIDRKIIRIDSEFVHAEIVKPALGLLRGKEYAGAQEEFLGAYEHYRHGKNKEALNDCLKAFESTMKAICDKRGWQYAPGDSAKKLIATCFENGLIPPFWEAQFNSLRTLLESSVPTGRNKLSGHGQGTEPTVVPDRVVSYMLHMTASALVFLISAEANLK